MKQARSWTRSCYWHQILLFIVGVLAITLRVWGVSLESLDGDEAFSYRVASSHIATAIDLVRNDLVHPPLYYFLLREWITTSGHASPLILRAVSLGAGFATVVLIACIGSTFTRFRTASLIAACLLATNDLHIFYSQQIRSYAFYTFLFACLLAWSWHIPRFMEKAAFWCIGATLMSLMVYTHYVGALYAACILFAVSLSRLPKRAKFQAWIAGCVAACSFIPWILLEIGPARQHHGTQDNLSWESVPSLYDLKAIWAGYLGIPNIHGATTVVLMIGCALVAVSVSYGHREQDSVRRLFLTTLALTAFVPPFLLFALGLKPVSLPIFGARHLLPSIVSYLLLVADGLIQLASRSRVRTAVLIPGVALLLVLELVPTVAATTAGPRRMPFRAIVSATQGSMPVYTTWPYGIGAVMNFYEHGHRAVQKLPSDLNRLPDNFVLIFRPGVLEEEREFQTLKSRWQDERNRDFYNGLRAGHYVRVAELQRMMPNGEPGS